MRNSLIDFLVDRDFYGHPVTVQYKGSSVYNTKVGAFFTLMTYALILFNLITLIQAFFDGSRQQES